MKNDKQPKIRMLRSSFNIRLFSSCGMSFGYQRRKVMNRIQSSVGFEAFAPDILVSLFGKSGLETLSRASFAYCDAVVLALSREAMFHERLAIGPLAS